MTTPTTDNDDTCTRSNRGGRLVRRLVLLLAATALTVLGLTSPASAATGSGWVRLAHLSPDTPSVNVALTSFGDSRSMLKLSDVGYGDVSNYQKVPAGRYVATMTPAGGGADSTPSITQAVNVEQGRAYTVAAVGTNDNLTGTVLDDDLTTPKAGSAKVRLLQASVSSPTTTVTAVGGPVLAQDATFGSSTGYATIKAGVWTLQVQAAGSSQPTDVKVTATPGSVNTIIVLDGKDGVVTAKAVKDASAAPAQPKKGTGVETGGGATATQLVGEPVEAAAAVDTPLALLAAALLMTPLALVARRRSTSRRSLAAAPKTRG